MPVRNKLHEPDKPEDYLLTFANNYTCLLGLLDIILETPQLKTYE